MSKENISKFVRNNGDGSIPVGKWISMWEEMLRDGRIHSVDVQDSTYMNFTALMNQARNGTEEGMEWLLTREPPANIDMQDIDGDTALIYAIDSNKPAKVRFLLDHKVDRSIKNTYGDTPLSWAKEYNKDPAIVELLVNYYPGNTSNSSNGSGSKTSQVSSNSDRVDKERVAVVSRHPMQPFNHSRIFITGRVGSGKTSLSHALRNKPPSSRVASTVGVETSVCEIHNAGVDDRGVFVDVSSGSAHTESAKAVARAIRRKEKNITQDKGLAQDRNNISNDDNDNKSSSSSTSVDIEMKKVGKAVKTVFIDENIDHPALSAVHAPTSTFGISSSSSSSSSKGGSKLVVDIDPDSVAKCCADSIESSSKYTIALYDFGGQSVFDVLHTFYMTRYGVYVLVFNMSDLLSPNELKRRECLSVIKYWMDSIAIHTLSEVEIDVPSTSSAPNLSSLALALSGGGNGGVGGSSEVKVYKTAPVALVGTRKDEISDPRRHSEVSILLQDNFCDHITFKSLLVNDKAVGDRATTSFFFFPVNNLLGRGDPSVMDLMTAIEREIDVSDYVHTERPINWLQTFDNLRASKRLYVFFDEVVAVSRSFGVDDDEVPDMLSFLHDMGMLMWHDEVSLRGVIIMDPVGFLFAPITNIICKHEATLADDSIHHANSKLHRDLLQMYGADYLSMKKKGLVSDLLMRGLLSQCGSNVDFVLKLMNKYGLVSVLTRRSSRGQQSSNQASALFLEKEYLVPSLLPGYPVFNAASMDRYAWSNSFYFFFAANGTLQHNKVISWSEMKVSGFLPSSLFERLICKAVSWSQQTSKTFDDIVVSEIFKDVAILRYGRQRFQLIHVKEYSCIRVDVEGEYPVAIYRRLQGQIELIIKESMKSLCFTSTLLYVSGSYAGVVAHRPASPLPSNSKQSPKKIGTSNPSSLTSSDIANHESIGGSSIGGGGIFTREGKINVDDFHVVLEVAKKMITTPSYVVESSNKQFFICDKDVIARFPGWFNIGPLDVYDVFLSHRWANKHDDGIVAAIFDILTNYTIGDANRPILTFLDTERLQKGMSFQAEFVKALTNSCVVVVILSRHALERLLIGRHSSSREDNCLIEWIISLECYHSTCQGKKVSRVFPIMMGSQTDDRIFDLFAEAVTDASGNAVSFLSQISLDVPVASLATARRLLQENCIPIDEARFASYTVKRVVDELLVMMGCKAWDIPHEHLTPSIAEQVRQVLVSSLPPEIKTVVNIATTATKNSSIIMNDDIEFDSICQKFGVDVIIGSGFTKLQDLKDYSDVFTSNKADPVASLLGLKNELVKDTQLPAIKAHLLAKKLFEIFK